MKFRYASDLHLEFAYGDPNFITKKDTPLEKDQKFADYADSLFPEMPDDSKTVLLLSGDICDNWRAHTRFGGFFKRISDRFSMVIWIPGNHEYYGHKFSDYHDTRVAMAMSQEYGNVFYWNRNRTSFDDNGQTIHIVAATLWADCNKNDPITAFAIGQGLNDYNRITFADVEENHYRSLRVSDTIAAHIRDRDYIFDQVNKFKAADPNCVVIVMTHHAPSWESVPERYQYNVLSHAYATHLNWENFTALPDFWLHGHLHDTANYFIDTLNVFSNPFGYPAHHPNGLYDPHAVLVIGEDNEQSPTV